MRRVRIEALAKAELAAAIEWYEERSPGLGTALHTRVDEVLNRLRHEPDGSTPVPGVPAEIGARRVFTRQFPYAVIYVAQDNAVKVLAFAHSSRLPNYWLERMQ